MKFFFGGLIFLQLLIPLSARSEDQALQAPSSLASLQSALSPWVDKVAQTAKKIASPFASTYLQKTASSPSTLGQFTTLLEQDTKETHLVSGEIRDMRFNDTVKTPRANFFSRYGKDLKLAIDQDDQMKEFQVTTDNLGLVQSRHQQFYKGLRVIGAGYILQEKDNSVNYALGKIVAGLNLDTNPAIPESEAFKFAKASVPADLYSWDDDPSKTPVGELVVTFSDFGAMSPDNAKLAWRFLIGTKEPSGSWTIDVDAHEPNGVILNHSSNVLNAEVSSHGMTYYNGDQKITADAEQYSCDSKIRYRLHKEKTKDPEIIVYDLRKPSLQGSCDPEEVNFTDSDDDNNFTDPEDKVGVSTLWAMTKTIDFFKKYNWLGLDGKGESKVEIWINVPSADDPYSNEAAYDPEDKLFYFGVNPPKKPSGGIGPYVSLDVVGHEFTHAIIRHALNEIDVTNNETKSLDEAFADIFGLLIRYETTGQLDWKVGSDLYSNGNYDRNLAYPKGDPNNPENRPHPDTYGGLYWDKLNEHSRAGVASHWFYLLVNGGSGTNDLNYQYSVESGVGLENAAKIVFRTMTTKLLPTSNYLDARLGSIAAVEDLFQGKPEHDTILESVVQAWFAVGVGDEPNDDTLIPPPDAQNVHPWAATLSWENKPSDRDIQVQVSTSHEFDENLETKSGSGQKIINGKVRTSETFDLLSGKKYFWRVRAKTATPSGGEIANPSRASTTDPDKTLVQTTSSGKLPIEQVTAVSKTPEIPWRTISFFQTGIPTVKGLSSPQNNKPSEVNLYWEDTPGASSYEIYVSRYPQLASIIQPGLETKSYHFFTSTENHKTISLTKDDLENSDVSAPPVFYWEVIPVGPSIQAFPQGERGRASKLSFFKISLEELKPLALYHPKNGAKQAFCGPSAPPTCQVAFAWEMREGIDYYHLVIYPKSSPSLVQEITVPKTQLLPVQNAYSQNACVYSPWEMGILKAGYPDPSGYDWYVVGVAPPSAIKTAGFHTQQPQPYHYDIVSDAPVLGVDKITHSSALLKWSNEYAPGGYLLTVDAPGGGYLYQNQNMGQQKSLLLQGLRPETKYTWKVSAGSVSAQSNFTTEAACNQEQIAGGVGASSKTTSLGKTSGSFNFKYNTYANPDAFTVTYQLNGVTKTWNSGCIGTNPDTNTEAPLWLTSPSLPFSGSDSVKVNVTGGCGDPNEWNTSTTAWEYIVGCPK